MKYTIRLATEQYCYLEVEGEGTPEEMVARYHEVKDAYQNPDRKTTCIKCREHIDVKEEASKLFSHKDQK